MGENPFDEHERYIAALEQELAAVRNENRFLKMALDALRNL